MADKCTEFFKAMADKTRQKILEMLEKKEMCVTEIVDSFNISQPTISHHLNILKNVGLVNVRKEGQLIYYSLNKDWLKECCKDYFSMFECLKKLFKDYKIVERKDGGEKDV
jgi:DNA-binding transcriptional ArsR family regulator